MTEHQENNTIQIQRYVPKEHTAIEHPDGLGVAYVGQHVNGGGRTQYTAIAYRGKARKNAFYESYRTAESRDKRVAEFFAGLTANARLKAATKALREEPHTLQPGDIIHHSWGWEQTNCDFYQVLSVTAHGATIQAISSRTVDGSTYSHGMADRQMPVKDAFHGERLKVRIDGSGTVTTLKHGCARKWDGKPEFCSWYA